jgi:hypothetical protein
MHGRCIWSRCHPSCAQSSGRNCSAAAAAIAVAAAAATTRQRVECQASVGPRYDSLLSNAQSLDLDACPIAVLYGAVLCHCNPRAATSWLWICTQHDYVHVRVRCPNCCACQVTWHASLDAVPTAAPSIYIAHEFLDALPVHQFVRDPRRGWLEVGPAASHDLVNKIVCQHQQTCCTACNL